jgi:hypothetical protein
MPLESGPAAGTIALRGAIDHKSDRSGQVGVDRRKVKLHSA